MKRINLYKLIVGLFGKLWGKLRDILRKAIFLYYRCLLSNKKDISVISSNCVGAMVLHELKMKFNSPFVNLFVPADDYVTLLENLEFYLGKTIENITPVDGKYPVGLLGGRIELHFMHYATFEDAVDCWNRRLKRINMDNLYVIMTERDGCRTDHLKRFGELPFKHKLAFCSRPFGKDKTFYYIKGFESLGEVDLLSYDRFTLISKWVKFNWAAFFNQK